MDSELINLTQRIEDLKRLKYEKQQQQLKEEKLRKIKEKKKRGSNVIIRVPAKFQNEVIKFIQEERIKNGLDVNPLLGTKIIALMMKHKNWKKIVFDCVQYDFNLKEDGHENYLI